MVPFFKAEPICDRTWQISYDFAVESESHVFAYLLEGDDYALVIDTMMGYGNMRAFCETLTDKPLKLANTHFHLDHTGGNFDFDACYLHPADMPYFYSPKPLSPAELLERGRRAAREKYRDQLTEADFTPEKPMRVYPIWDGDRFDLGGRTIEVIFVGGHTPGSVVFLDRAACIAFTGDACNGNTLLGFGNSLTVEEYLQNLLHFRRFKGAFDVMYGGHQVMDPVTVDEGIELCARIMAGTDDKERRRGMFGREAVYGACHTDEGFERADGKSFNMCYDPERIFAPEEKRQIIRMEGEKQF